MTNRKGRTTKHGKLYVTAGILVFLVALVLFLYSGVQPFATVEYDQGPLSPKVFTEKEASFSGGYDLAALEKGQYVLLLKVSGRPLSVPVLLRVEDTTAPGAQALSPRIVPFGSTLSPDQLITDVRDNDIVQVYFETPADFDTMGSHTVLVAIEDLSGNKSTVTCGYEVRGVGEGVTIEAGAPLPEAGSFLITDPVVKAQLVSPYHDDMTHHVGQYDVVFQLEAHGIVQQDTAHLTVVDAIAPAGQGVCLITEPGQTITPASFVTDTHDETDIAFAYVIAPDESVHQVQEVIVRMTDEGGNSTDVHSTLIASTIPPIQVEARPEPLNADDFGLAGNVQVEPFIPSAVGSSLVKVWIDGREEASYVTVVDTTPPTLSLRDVGDIYIHHPLLPEELFAAEDVFHVTLSYAEEPNWAQPGEQLVTVVATDDNVNRSELTRRITLLDDAEPPVIYGAVDRNVYEGETIAYLMGVWAQDNVDGSVSLTVDTQVNVYAAGSYDVTYTAVDRSGNASSATCVFTVIPPTVTEEEVRSYAKQVMDEITTPDMVDAEKLKAIYWYVRDHVRYGNGTNKNYSDWRRAARDGFVNGRGDCYNIWAVTKALLDQTDIEYVSVERLKSARRRTRHYWVNVNLGTGWYVFDPTWTPLHKFTCFMWTKKQCDSCRLYWLFKYEEYPPLATEPFDYDAVVAAEKAALLP